MPGFAVTRTEKSPEVYFDPEQGLLRIEGCSIHENAESFYRPLIERVEQYIEVPAPVTVIRINLNYFNSSTSKYLLDLLRIMDEINRSGKGRAELEWHHAEDDLDMEEAGQDYGSLLDMPVRMVTHPTG